MGKWLIMVGMFVSPVCLASKKPSEREFFIPARTHSGYKLSTKKQLAWQECVGGGNAIKDTPRPMTDWKSWGQS